MLLQTRKWMLEGEFQVEIADTLPDAIEILKSRCFDLILLCHSLKDPECQVICDVVFARSPDTRVLQLNEGWRDIRALTGPREQVSAARPQTLIRKITELTHQAQCARSGPPDLRGAS